MKKILLLDTNFSSSPIYDYLKNGGNEVFVLGGNPNDYLAKISENYFCIDYSDIKKCKNFIEEYGIDYIVPGCNDFSYNVCSKLNFNSKFPGIDKEQTIEKLHDKRKFREFAEKIGLHTPKIFNIETEVVKYPVIIKPSDSYSGRGNTVVRSSGEGEFKGGLEKAKSFSPSGNFVVEEFVEGDLFSHSAFIKGGEITVDFFVEEHCTANPFTVDTSRLTKNIPKKIKKKLRIDIEKIAGELKLVDGLIHTQFILRDDNFWILEVTRRCPGDLYSLLIQLSTGFNYAGLYASFFLGSPIKILRKDKVAKIIRHTISSSEPGLFSGVSFMKSLKIAEFFPLSTIGDFVRESPFSRQAIIFLDGGKKSNILFNSFINRDLYNLRHK